MKKININEIDFDLEYEGYIWYSNAENPELRSKISLEDFKDLPFIIEGNLYAYQEDVSVSIKNIDGEYHIMQGSLKDLPKEQITEQEFVAHKLKNVNKIKMIQFWEELESDALLEGMKTLKPSWRAFAGFKKD